MKMTDDLAAAKQLLEEGKYTCAVVKGESKYTSSERGVKPLLDWYEKGVCLKGYSAADKVVGKAAAFLYVLLEVKEVYSCVMSRHAEKVLLDNKIQVRYDCMTDSIRNRTNTGFCPMEQATRDIYDADKALQAIRETLKRLSEK